jgi:protein-disulfide isomerase
VIARGVRPMKQLILCSLVVAAACHPGAARVDDAGAAERARHAEELRALEQERQRDSERTAEDLRRLEQKLDALGQKLDGLIARGAAAPPRAPRPEPDRAKTYAVPIDGDPFEGRADAKVTIVKAYDYACPYCEKVRATLDDLKKRYGKDLRIVYKQLVVHPRNATAGALAFCAAARQGKGFEMDRLLWEKGFQSRQFDLTEVPLSDAPNDPAQGLPQTVKCWDHPDGCRNVEGWARELGLKLPRFKADMKGDCLSHIASDGRQLAQLGVAATPTFFINGRYLSGAQPIEQFIALIDEELKKASERIAAGTPAAAYYKKWVLEQGLPSLAP